MTASTITTPGNDGFDWRTQGVCRTSDADLHFPDVAELIEDGYSTKAAKDAVAQCEAQAKAVCVGCPIRSRCLSAAMGNDEEWGVWGGMTRKERLEYRPAWAAIKKSQGMSTKPTVQKNTEALHNNSGVSFRFRVRAEQAAATLERLMEKPADWELDTRKYLPARSHYGTHPRDTFVQLFDLIRLYPDKTAKELADRLGKSTAWFNTLTRVCRRELGTD